MFVGTTISGKFAIRMRYKHYEAQINNINSIATIVSFSCYRSRTGSIGGIHVQKIDTYLFVWLGRKKWKVERGCWAQIITFRVANPICASR